MTKTDLCFPGQNGIWVKFLHFWHKNDSEKWSRRNIFGIPPCAWHSLLNEFTFNWIFDQKYKIKIIFPRPFFTMVARNAKISPIFHFDQGNNSQICHILRVNMVSYFHKYKPISFPKTISYRLFKI